MENFKDVLNCLNQLAEETSSNRKIELLEKFCYYKLFRKVLKFALEDHRNYHVTKLPYFPIHMRAENTHDIFDCLTSLYESTGASSEDKNDLALLASRNESAWKIVSRIIKKDLRCGISAKSVNKAYPNLITVWPYMRCQSSTEKNMKRIKYPAQIEEKADGTHVDVVLKGNEVRFVSRRGRNMQFHQKLDLDFLMLGVKDDLVFIGEAKVVDKHGNLTDRKTGNGILNKAIKNTITQEEASRIVLTLWDVIPYQNFMQGLCTIPHNERFKKLTELFEHQEGILHTSIIQHRVVNNRKEASKFYKMIRAEGGEGAVIKNSVGIFKDHTSPNTVKVKPDSDNDAEFIITDWKHGAKGTKYEKVLGAIFVQSSDCKVSSWVGSGFSDQEREDPIPINSICTIRFESLIKKKDTENISLFLPRFIGFRFDKTKADDLKYLQKLTGEK